jgi:glycosyltransferase involved in cell wall biosynthesis
VLGVEGRLHFVDPVPAGMVKRFISTADVSLVLVQDACLSYRYSFPNKLLESLLAGLPVVASKLPEYEKLIARTGAGIAVDQADPMAIADGIREVLADKSRYAPQPDVLAKLESEFGWATQGQRLCSLYSSIVDANLQGVDQEAADLTLGEVENN